MKQKKFFVTGMAGYLGACLARELDRASSCKKFYGIDVKEPLAKYKKGEFKKMDMRDPALVDWIKEVQPDVIVHLAFVVSPILDEKLMREINIGGTKNVLKAVTEAGVKQLIVTSSGTAYGAWPDNPVPLKETDPIRQHPEFSYARDKAEEEFVLAEFAKNHPEVILTIIRPCTVCGPHIDNYISELFCMPIGISPIGEEPQGQFVHEDDVVRSILFLAKKEVPGPFNVGPPDILPYSQANSLVSKPLVPMPFWLLRICFKVAWRFQLPVLRVPDAFVDFVRYPWVVDSTKIMNLGFEFIYSSREAFEIMVRVKAGRK